MALSQNDIDHEPSLDDPEKIPVFCLIIYPFIFLPNKSFYFCITIVLIKYGARARNTGLCENQGEIKGLKWEYIDIIYCWFRDTGDDVQII